MWAWRMSRISSTISETPLLLFLNKSSDIFIIHSDVEAVLEAMCHTATTQLSATQDLVVVETILAVVLVAECVVDGI